VIHHRQRAALTLAGNLVQAAAEYADGVTQQRAVGR
jgi:hypothetical protein